MNVAVGTFNLNNLFSRFNFNASVQAEDNGRVLMNNQMMYVFNDPQDFRLRRFNGRIVKAKDSESTLKVAMRIMEMDLDVIAVQEVEDIDILKEFNRDYLNDMYPYQVLIEGNDLRLIDIGILSKLPVGSAASFKYAVHPEDSMRPIFSRDLLEVEILNPTRTKKLFTVYNNHLKSHFVPPEIPNRDLATTLSNQRRMFQAATIERIVAARQRPRSRFIILGDMNDPVDSEFLAPLTQSNELNLVDGLADPIATPSPKDFGTDKVAWTHRWKPSGQPAEYELYDQIWLSPSLADKQTGAFIHRRHSLTGKPDGSDHDPAWVEFKL